MTAALGTTSCRISSRFGVTCTFKLVTPVRLPPGRARLPTSPVAIGSAPISKTIGIVVVADFAASAAGAPPGATITATGRAASSAASEGNLLCWPSAQRNSIATFRPSTYPASPRPWRKALTRLANAAGDWAPRYPITGIVGCCARAGLAPATHTRPALPTNAMKSRRRMSNTGASPSRAMPPFIIHTSKRPPCAGGRSPLSARYALLTPWWMPRRQGDGSANAAIAYAHVSGVRPISHND